MTQLRLAAHSLVATAALLLASLTPRVALAQSSCSADSDCEQGFQCTVVGASGCAGAAPAPTCPPGESCEAPEPQPCETVELKACTPAPCTSDAQCAEGMVCHAWTQPCATTDCACSSDMPDCDCGPQPVCEPEAKSMCTPRYLLPCEQAADCGAGFTCEQQAAPCACAGGSEDKPTPDAGGDAYPAEPGFAPPEGSGGQPAGYPLPNPEPCVCEPSNVYVCVAQEIECTSDAACPAGWACEQEAQADAPACGGDGCPEPEPLPPARALCRPEYYGASRGVDGGLPGVPGSDPSPTGNAGTLESGSDNDASGDGEARDSSACQFGRAPASSGALSLFVMLGVLLGLKRRRR